MFYEISNFFPVDSLFLPIGKPENLGLQKPQQQPNFDLAKMRLGNSMLPSDLLDLKWSQNSGIVIFPDILTIFRF